VGKIKHARAALKEHESPDWWEDLTPQDLAKNKYAVTIRRDDEEWVDGAADLNELAALILGAAIGPEYDVEYVDSIMDLDTGEYVHERSTLHIVHVTIGNETGVASSP
jgi:hypothetical protein